MTTAKRLSRTQSKPSKNTSSVAVEKIKRTRGAFRTYEQAIKYLFDRTDYEKQNTLRYNVTTFSLDRMNNLLKALGDPHTKTKCVHIAGTKGKGSTATMLAKMLEANHYKVGLYTSPHVMTLHERIVINSEMISKKAMTDLINRVHPIVEKMAEKGEPPTFFEILTAMAFLYFFEQKVDIAVIETGLGGRLDSTNVITPEVVGITSISLDHMNLLGSTIDSIAREKAGVIKEGIPVITVPQELAAMRVLKKQAAAMKAPLCVTGKDIDFSYRFESSREYGLHNRICLTTPHSRYEHLRVPLPGEHQAINCGLALAMLDQLKQRGFSVDDSKAVEGLNHVSMIGRMEMICNDPRILVDGAHNAASIRALIQAIGQHIPYDSMIIIFGCNKDKDIRGMLMQLQYGADKVIFTRSDSPKAVYPQELADLYTELCGKMCQTAPSIREAVRIANSVVTREDLICITGSFYLVGQAKEQLEAQMVV
ncbi:MAG TPA: folylpolyglutamate synthase/dihydrofolate synthase family protein [Anaerohalosphaeraceae bacterium]|jgi:dihydrofolate synthase/folylpolyglutamate synthase|nr:folylpolyglutamate synthase/dihydrofolate synthase family protein [Anaerohalosphaeraceae bacterium]HPB93161.1 folylpolyglutamate synthase/dihydrofolate synthase family protein [Anaerohalosphaeraceae bacterium]HRT22552.1 folylpolyglutamate synthase/dihydrofolate synthase family protein [Anaerohalosphaeraceae bacterium]